MTAPSTRRLSRRDVLRGTVLVLGSVPGAALLAACGGSAPPAPGPAAQTGAGGAAAPTSAPAAAAQVAATPATAGGRTVVRDHDWLQGNPGQQGDWYDQFIAQFEDEHQDIKVQREWFPRNDMHAKELALAATGQIGDTVRINVAPLTAELQLKNVARELNSLYQSDQDWTNNDMKQFWPGNIKTYTREGKLYGLPVVGHPGAVQYYVNSTMIQKAGLKMPPADGNWKYDDLMALAKGLTQSQGGRTTVYGILPAISDTTINEGMVGMLRAFGGSVFDADGKQCLLNTDESKAALKVFSELWTSGAGFPWQPDISEQTPELFQSGKIGMVVQTSFAASAWPGQIAQRPDPFDMDVFPNPLGSSNVHATQVSSDGKGVTTASKVPDKAWIVLTRLFTSQQHGIQRFKNGLGSPGSRFDVWGSDEFNQIAPKLQNIAKVMVLPPAPDMLPWYYPANGRFQETEPILLNEWVKVTLGQMDYEQYADETAKQIQAILDKPSV